jgi:hypothetical protein
MEVLMAGFIGVFIVAAIVEAMLSLKWTPAYFRYGIPVFECEVQGVMRPPPESGQQIESKLPSSNIVPLKVRKIGEVEFACREAAWGGFDKLSYTPIMRGPLEYRADGSVKLTGLLTWSMLLFACGWLAFLILAGHHPVVVMTFSAALLGVMTWIYFIQRGRYEQLARTAATVRT